MGREDWVGDVADVAGLAGGEQVRAHCSRRPRRGRRGGGSCRRVRVCGRLPPLTPVRAAPVGGSSAACPPPRPSSRRAPLRRGGHRDHSPSPRPRPRARGRGRGGAGRWPARPRRGRRPCRARAADARLGAPSSARPPPARAAGHATPRGPPPATPTSALTGGAPPDPPSRRGPRRQRGCASTESPWTPRAPSAARSASPRAFLQRSGVNDSGVAGVPTPQPLVAGGSSALTPGPARSRSERLDPRRHSERP